VRGWMRWWRGRRMRGLKDCVYIVSLSLLFSFWISSVISLLIFWVERQPLGQHAHGSCISNLRSPAPGGICILVCRFYYSHSPFPPFLPHAGNILVPGVDDMVQAAGWRSGASVVLYLFIRGVFLSCGRAARARPSASASASIFFGCTHLRAPRISSERSVGSDASEFSSFPFPCTLPPFFGHISHV
jgi:hypothetical protein